MNAKRMFLVVLVFLLSACGLNGSVSMQQEQVAAAAAKIAEFDLPAGFAPDFSAGWEGYSMASYRGGDGPSHLYLIQSQDAGDGEKLAQALQDMIPGAGSAEARTTVIETRPVTVRGQATTLIISEGTNSEGVAYRQAMVAFTGNGGPALLVFLEPLTSWSSERVDALIASLR